MGRILLVGRLAVRDLRRRRIEAALLLLAIMAATTTLTLGLVLRDAASDPYQSTREATNGPDVVASVGQPAGLSGLEELASSPGVDGIAVRTRKPAASHRALVSAAAFSPAPFTS